MYECSVEFFLVFPLGGRDPRDDGLGGERWDGDIDGLVGVEGHVTVFVVVDVDVDCACYGCGFRDWDLVD